MFTVLNFLKKITFLNSLLLKRHKVVNLIQTLCKKYLEYAKKCADAQR